MGGGKETPRQKLIGLMYLVLMALLAMNVSKSILSAFITINQKFEDSATLITGNTDGLLANLDGQLAAAKGDEKKLIVAIQQNAIEIRKIAQKTANFYVKKASDMILESDPVMPNPFYTVDDDGNYKLMKMDTLTKKDDYDTPGHMFLQTEDTKSPNEAGDSIRQALFDYRDELVVLAAKRTEGKKTYSFDPSGVHRPHSSHDDHEFDTSLEEALKTVHEEDRTQIKRIMQLLTPPEIVHNHHDEYSWISYQFDHAVIVAAATIFTSLKNDVRMAESIAIDIITGRASVEAFKFNKIEPLAFSSTAYINQGDSLDLKVMIAAYDSTERMELRYWIDDTTKSETGKKEYHGKAGRPLALGGSVGEHTVVGSIAVKEKGVKKWKPWKFKYSVGAPNGAIANSEMNVLYRGWDNKIEVSASGYDPSTVNVSCSGCKISKKGDGYIARVSGSAKKASLNITAKDAEGASVKIVSKEFRIFNLPSPKPYFAGQTFDKPTIKKAKAANSSIVKALIGDSPLDVKYTVTGFKMSGSKNGKSFDMRSKGNKLTGEMKAYIKRLGKSSKIIITDIVAQGPSGKPKKIGSLVFKVI